MSKKLIPNGGGGGSINTGANLIKLDSYSHPHMNAASCVAIDGDYAYVGSGYNYIVVLNISNPSAITFVTSITNSAFWGVRGMEVSGTTLFVISFNSWELTSINISTPSTPTIITSFFSAKFDSPQGMILDATGDYLHVISGTDDQVTLVDVSNPAIMSAGTSLTDVTNLNNPQDIVRYGDDLIISTIVGDRVTSVGYNSGYTLLSGFYHADLNSVLSADWSYNTALDTDVVYAVTSTTIDKMVAIDLTNQSSPSYISSLDGIGFNAPKLIRKDPLNPDIMYVIDYSGDTFFTIDVSNTASMSVADSLTDAVNMNSPTFMVIRDNIAYVTAEGSDALVTIDLS